MCFEFEHSSKTEVGKLGESPTCALLCRCSAAAMWVWWMRITCEAQECLHCNAISMYCRGMGMCMCACRHMCATLTVC